MMHVKRDATFSAPARAAMLRSARGIGLQHAASRALARRLLFAALIIGAAGHCEPVALPSELQEQVDHLIALISDGYAVPYSEATRHHVLSGEQSELGSALVLFSVEGFGGGNSYASYMALFRKVAIDRDHGDAKDKKAHYLLIDYARVGGKSWRAVDHEKVRFEGPVIVLSTSRYSERDAACCPSVPRSPDGR